MNVRQVLADDQRRTLFALEGRSPACVHGRQQTDEEVASLRIEILKDREIANERDGRGMDLVVADLGKLLLERGTGHRSIGVAKHLDNPVEGRVLQCLSHPAWPAMVHDVTAQKVVDVHEVFDAGSPEHNVQRVSRE